MTNSVVDQFAAYLAQEEDPAKRARIIKRAQMLALNQAAPEAFEPPVTSLGDYLDTPIEVPPSVVWPTICVRGELTATIGRAGFGKTTFTTCRLLKWAAGLPMFASHTDKEEKPYMMPEKPLKTLIIENEGSAGMFHQKMGIMVNKCGDILSDDDRKLIRENVYVWGDGGYSGLKLDDDGMLQKVRAGVDKVQPDIVFVEPFRSLWKGEENSSTDMANIVDNLVALATDYGCSVMLSHHERKGGAGEDDLMSAGRGSTVLEGVVAVMENFQKAKGGDYREVTWSKARYLQPPPPPRMKYDPATHWYAHVPSDEIENGVFLALRASGEEPMTIKDLSEETGETQAKLRAILTDMTKQGTVKKMPSVSTGEGSTGNRYRLVSADTNQFGGLDL